MRILRYPALSFLLACSVGCLNFVHPCQSPPPEKTIGCQELPRMCRDHVYIFLIHGLDPLDCANMNGLNNYLHQLGFNKTYYGQLYSRPAMEKELLKIQAEDPSARFAFVGFSFGANQARDLTHFAGAHGMHVDLLVYFGGNTLKNVPEDRPENTTTIVNVLACGCIWNGAQLDGAINMEEPDVFHFGSPCHPRSVEILTEELTLLAASVPFVENPTPLPTSVLPEPAPRSVRSVPQGKPDEWDFLKPVSRVRTQFEK